MSLNRTADIRGVKGLGTCVRVAVAAAAAVVLACGHGVEAAPTSTGHPSHNIAPKPSYTAECSHFHSNSAACIANSLAAIDRARSFEHVRPMVLPDNFTKLSFAEQTFVVSNLERVDRGRRPFLGITSALNQTATKAAQERADPTPATSTVGRFAVLTYGSNWTANFGPLAGDYGWMYDDGYGSYNVDCSSPAATGCWGHRDVILSTYSDKPLLISGAGSDKQNGLVSIAQMFVGGQGRAPQFTYTWAEALRHGADARH
jgi:hypothetical protein